VYSVHGYHSVQNIVWFQKYLYINKITFIRCFVWYWNLFPYTSWRILLEVRFESL